MKREDFEVAHDIAQQLVENETDVNEVSKALEYLILCKDTKKFFMFLRKIINNGFVVVRSNKTLDYYRNILDACNDHLKSYNDYKDMSEILGWAIRLMRYYRVTGYSKNKEKITETKHQDKTKTDQKESTSFGSLLKDAMKKKSK